MAIYQRIRRFILTQPIAQVKIDRSLNEKLIKRSHFKQKLKNIIIPIVYITPNFFLPMSTEKIKFKGKIN